MNLEVPLQHRLLPRLSRPPWTSGILLRFALATYASSASGGADVNPGSSDRPGTQLGPDRRAPQHHRSHGSPPLPELPAINLTRITRIMPEIAHVLLALRCARKGNSGMAAGLGPKANALNPPAREAADLGSVAGFILE